MSIWDDAKKNLVEWYGITAGKTSEMAKVTSLRYDRFGLSRDIERQFSELGSVVYHGLKEERDDLLAAEEVTVLVERIGELEVALRGKQEEIEFVRREHAARKAAAAKAGAAEMADDAPPATQNVDSETAEDEEDEKNP